MSLQPIRSIRESNFGDNVEFVTRLTQQQFHGLRNLMLQGLDSPHEPLDDALLDDLVSIGMLTQPNEHDDELYELTESARAFSDMILEHSELFSRTSQATSLHGDPSLFHGIPEGRLLLFRPVPLTDEYPYDSWGLYDEGERLPLPSSLSLDFFVRHGIYLVKRESNTLYGYRFRDDVVYQLHVHVFE